MKCRASKSSTKTKTKIVKPRARDALMRQRDFLTRASELALLPAARGGSPHPTVKVGALLVDAKNRVIASAANRFARGVDRRRSERYVSGQKSLWFNCAEQLAIADAARRGVKLAGSTLYVTLEPCAMCAGLLAEIGVKRVCVPVGAMRRYAKLKAKWKESIEIGIVKLAEAGVPLTYIS